VTTTGINYRGIAFPFQVGNQSIPLGASDEDLIKMSLVQIVTTQPGERYMNPEFGCGALNFLFEPDNGGLVTYIQESVSQAIRRWEPRVTVSSVDVERNSMFDGQIIVTIRYNLVATNEPGKALIVLGSP